jgi:hypothetical protein
MKTIISIFTIGASVISVQANTLAPYQYSKIIYYQDRSATTNTKQPVVVQKNQQQKNDNHEN